ncbi:MAG: glycosyltransferase family 39 protein [Flavobacteriales bacterium]|nr:glycosyltransferase family 39 protein [Flavobacteriales bacterium]
MSTRKKEQLAPAAPREPLSATSDPRTNAWFWPLIAAALLAVIAIYHQVPSFAFTDWDDLHYISDNALLKSLSIAQVRTEFSRYVMGNYHPITMLSYSAEIALFGKSPGAMHVTNLLLHLLNVVLVGLFLRKLTRNDLLAALVALLWAVHPMRVESVAWLSARKDLLMLCFGLLMLLAYLRWRDRERPVWYLLAFVAFLFSGLSKAMAVSFVPCLLLIDLARPKLEGMEALDGKDPFFLAAMVLGLVAVAAQKA